MVAQQRAAPTRKNSRYGPERQGSRWGVWDRLRSRVGTRRARKGGRRDGAGGGVRAAVGGGAGLPAARSGVRPPAVSLPGRCREIGRRRRHQPPAGLVLRPVGQGRVDRHLRHRDGCRPRRPPPERRSLQDHRRRPSDLGLVWRRAPPLPASSAPATTPASSASPMAWITPVNIFDEAARPTTSEGHRPAGQLRRHQPFLAFTTVSGVTARRRCPVDGFAEAAAHAAAARRHHRRRCRRQLPRLRHH